MRRTLVATLSALTIVTLVACSGSNEEAGSPLPTSSQPSVAVEVSGAPSQPSRGSRAPVSYDPCVSLGDSVVAQAGFDPQTREREDLVFDDYALIGCMFDRKEQVRGQSLSVGFMTVTSTNVSLDEFKLREPDSQSITVWGRDAITYSPPADGGCFVVMTGPDAAINIHVSSSPLTSWNACDHSIEIAQTIESALTK